VWNVGERVEGYTNLLWVVLLAPLARLGNLGVLGVAMSFVFSAATLVLYDHIGGRIRPHAGPFRRGFAALLLVSNPSFANAAVSGMESSCFGFSSLLALFFLIRGRERPALRRWAALCFCGAYLTRPEGVLLAAVALTVEMIALTGPLQTRVRALAPVALILAATVAAHVAFRLSYYGYPLPNTFYAKVILGSVTLVRGAKHVEGFLLAGGWLTLPGLLELRHRGARRTWFAHGYCLLFAYVAYLVLVGGDHPYWYRFYVPLLPLPLLATAESLERALIWLGRSAARFVGAQSADTLAAAVAIALCSVASYEGFGYGERMMVVTDPNILTGALAVWEFFKLEAPRDSFVAAQPIGYLGYHFPGLHVLDMWGLTDVHIAHLNVPATAKFGHDKFDVAYVASQKPDYAFLFALPVPIAGYDLCWPSQYIPFSIYRRNFPLLPTERLLGTSSEQPRHLLVPPCRPPVFPGPLSAAPAVQ
jgi:hypothetical protein